MGQTVLIDNRGGAGGTVGTEQVARSNPDGYTLIYGTQGTMAANVTLRKSLPYDPLKSFVPVHMVGQSPNVFVAFEGAPYKTVVELIAYAKQNPGKVTFASAGSEPRPIWSPNCSRASPASICCTCPTRAARRR